MNRNLVVIIVVVIFFIAAGAFLMGDKSGSVSDNEILQRPTDLLISETPTASLSGTITASPAAETTKSATGSALSMTDIKELKIEDLKVGSGNEAKAGNLVTVNYKGTLTDGTQFDSSYDRGQPFSFNVGAGDVIKGWDQGVPGMKVGGKRKLTIPSDLAYGARGVPGIPPNSTLVFEIELLKVE